MSALHPAMSPAEKALYQFAVRQVRAHGYRAREFKTRSLIWRILFGSTRELTPRDLHIRPEPARRPLRRTR